MSNPAPETEQSGTVAGRFFGRETAERGRNWLIGAVVIALVAILLRQVLIALLAAAVAMTIGLVLLWQRNGLTRVTYTRSFSRTRAFPGEEVTLEITVENAKILPLPWLEVVDELPKALEFPDSKLEPSSLPNMHVMRSFLNIGPYERVRRRYRVICPRRGFHGFGHTYLKTGDIFGFSSIEKRFDRKDAMIVYPQIVPVTELGLPPKQPFGDERPIRPLVEDPLRFRGVRPYSPGDSPRHIHWRATARTGAVQSKQFEPSSLPTLAMFLDVNTFEHFWEGLDPERLELAISATASLAAHGLDIGRQVGLYVNAPMARGERTIRIGPSRHPSQLRRILDALAMVILHTGNRVETLIAEEARRMPWGATVVVITGRVTEGLEDELARLHRSGHAITLIAFGTRPDLAERPGFRVHWLGEEVTLEGLAELQLA
ncbi:MAG: DUF58 domain-containing protein [Thermomicrobiaceae bacterium]